MLNAILVGIIQGVVEWLPLSSEGMVNLFLAGDGVALIDNVNYSIFLHLGTMLAAIIYFRSDIWRLISDVLNRKTSDGVESETRQESIRITIFLIVATFLSGVIGYFVKDSLDEPNLSTFGVSLIIGLALIVTGGLQLARKGMDHGQRSEGHVNTIDSVILGIGQAFTAIPGISRSGTTVALLLFRNFDEKAALRLSFLMSIPLVAAADVLLLLEGSIALTSELLVALLAAFISGLLSISLLMKLVDRVNFGWAAIVIGVLVVLGGLV